MSNLIAEALRQTIQDHTDLDGNIDYDHLVLAVKPVIKKKPPRWLEFIDITDDLPGMRGRKTRVFAVNNKEMHTWIGKIKWYSPFRKYSFFPYEDMVFEATCMQDITDFLVELMEKHKQQSKMKTEIEFYQPKTMRWIKRTLHGEVSDQYLKSYCSRNGGDPNSMRRIVQVKYDPNPKPKEVGGRVDRPDLGKLGALALE